MTPPSPDTPAEPLQLTRPRSARMAQPTRQDLVFGFAAFGSCGARTSVRSIQQASKNPGRCTSSEVDPEIRASGGAF